MGKKKRLFIDKVMGAGKGRKCPVCGELIKIVKIVKPYINDETGTWRYKNRIEHYCKCNTKELFFEA